MMMLGGDPKRLAAMIVGRIPKDGAAKENADAYSARAKEVDEPVDESELSAAEDILDAISRKDARGLALALRDAFEIFDSSPHVEGPDLEQE